MPSLIAAGTRSYWLPFFVFAALTTLEGYLPASVYPWAYTAKVLTVTALVGLNRRALPSTRLSGNAVLLALVIGVVVFAQWVLIEELIPYPHLGSRTAFNPFEAFSTNTSLGAFLIVRLFGLIVMVPTIEELFWRGFALRYFTNEDFETVPMGVFSMSAFWIVTAGSAATHPEWLVALIAFALYAWLLKSTRSLFAVILAHATSNAALGAFIFVTRKWYYW